MTKCSWERGRPSLGSTLLLSQWSREGPGEGQDPEQSKGRD